MATTTHNRDLLLLLLLRIAHLTPTGASATSTGANHKPHTPAPQECTPPVASRNNQPIRTGPTITHNLHTKDHKIVQLTTLDDDPTLQLTYVHNLLEPQELHALVQMADDRHGWVRSPLKAQKSGDALHSEIRNSTSCPMLWPLVYAHLRDELAEKRPELLAELELVTAITERVAALFRATGLDSITASYIEPLQLVKYAPSERFGPQYAFPPPASPPPLPTLPVKHSSALLLCPQSRLPRDWRRWDSWRDERTGRAAHVHGPHLWRYTRKWRRDALPTPRHQGVPSAWRRHCMVQPRRRRRAQRTLPARRLPSGRGLLQNCDQLLGCQPRVYAGEAA